MIERNIKGGQKMIVFLGSFFSAYFRRQYLGNGLSDLLKGILWQFYKLVLKVPSGRDENDGIGHFAELGSSWPGEAKTWPKIALRVGGRAEKYCVGGRAAGRYWAARPQTPKCPLMPRPAGAKFGHMNVTIDFV